MNQIVRLFCLKSDSALDLKEFLPLLKSLDELAYEYATIFIDDQIDYIYSDGENFFFGRSIIGPLKPKDNSILKKGKVIDLILKTQGASMGFEQFESHFENDKNERFLARISTSGSKVGIHFYAQEDIDL